MEILIVLLFLISVLWLLDMWLTLKVTSLEGNRAEENPFLRFLLRHNRKDFILFKVGDLVLFIFLVFYIFKEVPELTYLILVIFAFIYTGIVYHNLKILEKEKINTSS